MPALLEAASAARAISRHGSEGRLQIWRSNPQPAVYQTLDPLDTLSADAKIHLLEQVDNAARLCQDPRVNQVMVSLTGGARYDSGGEQRWRAGGRCASPGTPERDVIVEQNGRREQGSSGGGGRIGYGWFLDEDRALAYAREAVRLALVNLDAVPAPAGTMKVSSGAGRPGNRMRPSAMGWRAISTARELQHLADGSVSGWRRPCAR